jgi:hypothetical protein
MPARKATVALANKMARIAWALLTKQTRRRQKHYSWRVCCHCSISIRLPPGTRHPFHHSQDRVHNFDR